jgi:hypothetical protein
MKLSEYAHTIIYPLNSDTFETGSSVYENNTSRIWIISSNNYEWSIGGRFGIRCYCLQLLRRTNFQKFRILFLNCTKASSNGL